MKICWDNLEKLRYNSKTGKWHRISGSGSFVYREYCVECGESYLADINSSGRFCCTACAYKTLRGKNSYWYNKKFSDEHKKNISKNHADVSGENNPLYGIGHTIETRIKLSKAAKDRGWVREKHPNWRGGIAGDYAKYCAIFKDKGWRAKVYQRDIDKFCWNPECDNSGNIEVLHHIDYNKENCCHSNIIKICNVCNSKANFNREWWEAFYKEIMRRRGIV